MKQVTISFDEYERELKQAKDQGYEEGGTYAQNHLIDLLLKVIEGAQTKTNINWVTHNRLEDIQKIVNNKCQIFHGLRIARDSILFACSSLMNRSLSGSHLSFRPNSIEIFPICAMVKHRCPISGGK